MKRHRYRRLDMTRPTEIHCLWNRPNSVFLRVSKNGDDTIKINQFNCSFGAHQWFFFFGYWVDILFRRMDFS